MKTEICICTKASDTCDYEGKRTLKHRPSVETDMTATATWKNKC